MSRLVDTPAYDELVGRFSIANKLGAARNLLIWDSQTSMPRGGESSRGEQLAALDVAAKGYVAAVDNEDLLAQAEAALDRLSTIERANLVEMRRIWRHRIATPSRLIEEKAKRSATLLGEWKNAKASNDYGLFADGFAEMLSLHREIAAAKSEALNLTPYDALIDEVDPGLSTALADPVFGKLEAELPPLLAEVLDHQSSWPDPIPLTGDFSVGRQRALADKLLETVGLDVKNCRIDTASHPFALSGCPGDIRIATRFDTGNIRYAIMANLHEAGHALYEFNLPRDLAFSPVGSARGATTHESQSIMVEMQAGRSLEFLSWLAPQLHDTYGGDAAGWSVANILNSYRRVGTGFIRVEADEISYPLHVILRYRIERALLSGDLTVADLPGAWSDLSQTLFGRSPPDDAQGCLQDIHWAAGLFGYFPNYALGASLAAQLFERACADDRSVLPGLGQGDFGPYRTWIAPRVHQRASTVPFAEMVLDATGAPLSGAALMRHLRHRYLREPPPHQL